MVDSGAGKQPSIRRLSGALRWILRLASAASLATAIALVPHQDSAAATTLFVLAPVLLAQRAGIEFTAYVLPARIGHDGETLTAAMFPRSVLFQRVAGVQREWGPLRPLQKFVHFWLAMFTDVLQTPPTSRRAMREAAKRPL